MLRLGVTEEPAVQLNVLQVGRWEQQSDPLKEDFLSKGIFSSSLCWKKVEEVGGGGRLHLAAAGLDINNGCH